MQRRTSFIRLNAKKLQGSRPASLAEKRPDCPQGLRPYFFVFPSNLPFLGERSAKVDTGHLPRHLCCRSYGDGAARYSQYHRIDRVRVVRKKRDNVLTRQAWYVCIMYSSDDGKSVCIRPFVRCTSVDLKDSPLGRAR